jgi:hypothetical protein
VSTPRRIAPHRTAPAPARPTCPHLPGSGDTPIGSGVGCACRGARSSYLREQRRGDVAGRSTAPPPHFLLPSKGHLLPLLHPTRPPPPRRQLPHRSDPTKSGSNLTSPPPCAGWCPPRSPFPRITAAPIPSDCSGLGCGVYPG